MYWKELTTDEIAKIDKTTPVIIPIGSIEQHGSHLPVSTDSSINEHLCHHLNAKQKETILILPTIYVTCSSHHLEFCGSLTVSHETFLAYLKDIVESVLHHGFTNIVIFNSHGGNQAIAQVAGESLAMKHHALNMLVVTWWRIIPAALQELCEGRHQDTGHACFLETSLMLYQNETQVRKDKLKKGSMLDGVPAWSVSTLISGSEASVIRTMKELTANGIQGDPTKATAENGRIISETFVSRMSDLLLDFVSPKFKRTSTLKF